MKEELCPDCGAERKDQGFHYDGQRCDCGWSPFRDSHNPCETHRGVHAPGFCPVCLLNERDTLSRALEQACRDLNAAHDELMLMQGLTREEAALSAWKTEAEPPSTDTPDQRMRSIVVRWRWGGFGVFRAARFKARHHDRWAYLDDVLLKPEN